MPDYERILENARFIELSINQGQDVLISWLAAIMIEQCWMKLTGRNDSDDIVGHGNLALEVYRVSKDGKPREANKAPPLVAR